MVLSEVSHLVTATEKLDLLEAVTSAMRAVIQKLAELQSPKVRAALITKYVCVFSYCNSTLYNIQIFYKIIFFKYRTRQIKTTETNK